MKKQLLYTFAILLFASNSIAQITISSVPVIVPNMLDSFSLPLSAGAVPSVAPATNGSWDLGAIAIQPGIYTIPYRTPTPAFSIANFADSLTNGIFPTVGISYKSWRNVQQSSAGVSVPGEEILTRQAFGLGSFTGNILDSVVFPLQAIHYSNAVRVMKLPFALDSSWSTITSRNMNFNVTLTAYGLNNTPAQHRQTRRVLDSVVGWGRMRVPVPGSGASAWIQVLQVQHSVIVLDSFFLAAGPAPAPLLSALGLTQGQTSTHCYTYFYRAGALRPLAEAEHSGPSFSSAPFAFYMHARNLPIATAVYSIPANEQVSIYPNPVRNGRLKVAVTGNARKDYSYVLVNMAGQLVGSGPLSSNNAANSTEISLPNDLEPGLYYITFINGTQASTLPITVE